MIKIYTLSDPVTGNIRYVGKTAYSLNTRLYAHIAEAKNRTNKTHKLNWIRSLVNKGIEPVIELLDEIDSDSWEWLESYWISQLKQWSINLTNLTDGGDGNKGQVFTKESIDKRIAKLTGQKRTDKQKQNISDSLKGKPKSKEHIAAVTKTVQETQGKSILQFDMSGNFIKEWPSIREAAKALEVDKTSLSRTLQGKFKHTKGFKWEYK